ncbi:hypothetical protein AWC15_06620 [Mycobacterium lacus]|nr:hypothetical protein AWC15_06620 [Mycobacterium lacus]
MNFSFYEERPSEFLHMRIEVLSLMLCNEQQLASAYAADRIVAGIQIGGTTPPDNEMRSRYVRTEAVVIFHHAAEMILRLFYAHVDYPDCPWLGMASLVSFAEFKEKVAKSLSDGFDRSKLAEVFLGGSSPRDACIAMSDEDFEDAIDGVNLLLGHCGHRLLSQSFLYNSIKHGLSTIALDEATEIAVERDRSRRAVGHKGPMFAYMHRRRRPGDAGGGREWFISMTGATTPSDLALSILVARAVESLWDVARRRYTGKSGSIRHIRRSVVELAIYGLLRDSLNIVNTVTMEMPKLNDDGSHGDVEHDFIMNHMPKGLELPAGEHPADTPRINLPARQRDQRVFSTSKRAFYPFSPKGSQRA